VQQCACTKTALLDDLVGAQQERLGDGEPERLGGLEVDDELEFVGLLDWDVAGFRAAQNLVDKIRGTTELIRPARSIGDQATRSTNLTTFYTHFKSRFGDSQSGSSEEVPPMSPQGINGTRRAPALSITNRQ
jgi:hypothetical protein